MEAAEEGRIERLKSFFKAFTESQRVIMPIIDRCLEGMDAAADTCDPRKVCYTLCLIASRHILTLFPMARVSINIAVGN